LATGSLQCHQENKQDYAGWQLGADLGKLNLSGTGVNWHFGVTGGNFYARADEQKLQPAPGSSAFPTGDLKGNFEVPFVGFYNVIMAGNFFADAQLRWDFLNSTTSSAEQHFSGMKGRRSPFLSRPQPPIEYLFRRTGSLSHNSAASCSDESRSDCYPVGCREWNEHAAHKRHQQRAWSCEPSRRHQLLHVAAFSLRRRFCTSLPGA
jgi:hypothetical protein